MSDKIIAVMGVMCRNPQHILDVTPAGDEYFFRYKSHVMSVIYRNQPPPGWGPYSVYIYPGTHEDLRELASALDRADPDDIGVAMVAYHSHNYEEEPMRQLYNCVRGRYLNIDGIFDDILSDSDAEKDG